MVYEGSFNTEDYCRILDEGLLATAEVLHPDGYHFSQDNAPCHTAAYTTTCLLQHCVQTLPWPLVSPNLNPIENLWSVLKVIIEKQAPRTKQTLKLSVEEEWYVISVEIIANLVTSMTSRLKHCVESEGNSIMY